MNTITALMIFLVAAGTIVPSVSAAKPRLRTAAATSRPATVGYSRAKLSRSTNSVIVTFVNLTNVSKVTYTLSYTANGVEQGAMGSLTPNGAATDTRDLYFGTCSHGVCTPHRGIQNAVLLIETQLSTGIVNSKRYRIRI